MGRDVYLYLRKIAYKFWLSASKGYYPLQVVMYIVRPVLFCFHSLIISDQSSKFSHSFLKTTCVT